MNTDCAGFDIDSEWAALPATEHNTAFLADKEDADGSIAEDKPVTAETIMAKMGDPIDVLIERGRVQEKQAEADFRKSLDVQSA